MKHHKLLVAGSVIAFGILGASNASASYMSKCDTLIEKWEACQESSQSCKAETTAIEEQCKCHVQKGDEWKLVMAAVGKDGVCAPRTPVDPPPPPPPPPPKPEPIITYGGERGPDNPKPNKGDPDPNKADHAGETRTND